MFNEKHPFPDYDPGKDSVHSEYCENCYDVFPTEDMVQVGKYDYWCRMCHKEQSHHINGIR